MKVRLTKLKESDDPLHPNNIEVGHVKEGTMMEPPTEGECFYVLPGWRTSVVQEIIDENTFRTHNSIYKWEIIEDGKE